MSEEILKSSTPGFLQLRTFQGEGLVHAFSTREGGVSRPPYHSLNLSVSVGDASEAVRENRRRFFSALGVDPLKVVRVRQVHGDGVLVVGKELVEREGFPRILLDEGFEYDALITDQPDLALGIGTADCFPILLFDPKRRVIGAVHAGWRSTVKRIAEKTVQAMASAYGVNPWDILAAIGPGIGVAAKELGLSCDTLHRWEAAGKIEGERSPNGHRRDDLAKLRGWVPRKALSTRVTLAYARVSRHDQKDDLTWQVGLHESFGATTGWRVEGVQALGAGVNSCKRGLRRLIAASAPGNLAVWSSRPRTDSCGSVRSWCLRWVSPSGQKG